jgi:Sulfotransferase family
MIAVVVLLAGFLLSGGIGCPTPDGVVERYRSARAVVSAKLANMTDEQVMRLPCKSAGVHGSMPISPYKEKGCAAAAHFCDASTRSRARFWRFPLFSPCQLYVSHKYRAVFVRQPKSASTAVLDALKEAMCETRTCHADEFSEVPALRPHVFDEYAVFTFVRNPWTRAVSAYRMMHKWFLRQRNADDSPGKKCGVPFKAFARDADALVSACSRRGCCPYIASADSGSWAPWFVEQHVNDQSGCATGMDYVGRAEHSQADWDGLVRFLNRRTNAPAVREGITLRNPNGQAPGGAVETKCDAFRRPDVVREIALQYATDVIEFGYLPDIVSPTV